MPPINPNIILSSLYPEGSLAREVLTGHSEAVADMALEILDRKSLPLDRDEVYTAAMLHDIGICFTNAPSIGCHGTEPYIRHGILGAALLRDRGVDEKYARVAERHTGAGLTAAEIEHQGLPLPHVDLLPETMLERLICYADKFYSKSGSNKRKPLESVRRSMITHGPETLARFEALHREFGI